MKAVSSPETVEYFDDQYNNCTIRYGDMKKQLAEDIINFTEPFREKVKEISANEDYIRKVVKMGKEKAHISSAATVKEVREIIGFREF
jgi:tryptophanyl-tRNA synthetase